MYIYIYIYIYIYAYLFHPKKLTFLVAFTSPDVTASQHLSKVRVSELNRKIQHQDDESFIAKQ